MVRIKYNLQCITGKTCICYQISRSTPDGLFLHGFGPCEGRIRNLIMYRRSKLGDQLQSILKVGDTQYAIYSYSSYETKRWLLTPEQGSNIRGTQTEMTPDAAKSIVTVE